MERRVYLAQRLNRFLDCHRGERMVLVCNGPSLNQTDFAPIRGEICMGLNKIYLGFKRFRFYPRYYLAINRRVIEQGADEIRRLACIRFLRDLEGCNPLPESALTYLLHSRPEQRFHENLCEGFFEGFTVTFAALQIAFFMGFSEVVIVGMDHRYAYKGLPNEAHKLVGADPNHFDPSYFSGHTWDNPDLQNSERYYSMARESYEAAGRRIIDCTVDGACAVFEKGRLEEVLR
ncbi:hypothetical protein [Vulcanococcus sp. Clear-D1]|uniref:hypothetical protein n=1 Tax=Vulcanococcus sp. Clear-D1 TaxID=2766970 RepID=UPI0025DD58D7|nr:hypothetical protein [Vulcanococcus sp. Clear-D1]